MHVHTHLCIITYVHTYVAHILPVLMHTQCVAAFAIHLLPQIHSGCMGSLPSHVACDYQDLAFQILPPHCVVASHTEEEEAGEGEDIAAIYVA